VTGDLREHLPLAGVHGGVAAGSLDVLRTDVVPGDVAVHGVSACSVVRSLRYRS
jgi:hypothetical protein